MIFAIDVRKSYTIFNAIALGQLDNMLEFTVVQCYNDDVLWLCQTDRHLT